MWNPASSSVCPLVPFFTSSLSSPYLLSFTNMLKNKQPTAVSIRATMQQQHLASARNRRLAQQMENRPSVQAALSHKQVSTTRRPTDSVTVGGRWRATVHSVTNTLKGFLIYFFLFPLNHSNNNPQLVFLVTVGDFNCSSKTH